MPAGLFTRVMEDLHHALVQRLFDERGFSAAGDPGDNGQKTDGEFRIDLLEIILPAPFDRDVVLWLPASRGDVDLFCPGEVLSGQGLFVLLDLLRVSFRNDMAAVHPGVTVADVHANTGFEVLVSESLATTEQPTDKELEILRMLDPRRQFIG